MNVIRGVTFLVLHFMRTEPRRWAEFLEKKSILNVVPC